jgi:hypothetical protein
MDIITEDQDLPIPLQSKRAIQDIPLLATLGIMAPWEQGLQA